MRLLIIVVVRRLVARVVVVFRPHAEELQQN